MSPPIGRVLLWHVAELTPAYSRSRHGVFLGSLGPRFLRAVGTPAASVLRSRLANVLAPAATHSVVLLSTLAF